MNEATRAALARNLKAARLAKGLTQEQLANATGVPRTDIVKIESASSGVNPTMKRLIKLADELGTTASDLLRAEAQ